MNKNDFTPRDTVRQVWTTPGLLEDGLISLNLLADAECCPTSFKVGHLAQAAIGLSGLSAALMWTVHNSRSVPSVTVSAEHACVVFKSERLYVLNGKDALSSFGTIGGLYRTRSGYIRMHDGLPNHRRIALEILSLRADATKEDIAENPQWRPTLRQRQRERAQ